MHSAVNAQARGDNTTAERRYRALLAKGGLSKVKLDDIKHNLGIILVQAEKFGEAEHLLRTVDPRNMNALNNRSVCLKKLGRTEEAAELLSSAEKPNIAMRANLGSCLLELGDPEEAERVLAAAVMNDPKHVDAQWNLSLSRLVQKKWHNGWLGYEWGFKAKERHARPWVNFYNEWQGEDPKGKTILVWGEQGVGDEILFAQCVPDLHELGAKVVFDCHPRLEEIFQHSFPWAEVHGTRKSDKIGWVDHLEIDWHAPVGSLPNYLRNTDEDFPETPYLKPTKRLKRGKGLRVGLSWAGGTGKTSGEQRSFPLERLISLMELGRRQGVTFVSLQYTQCQHEIKALRNMGYHIEHDDYRIENLEEQFSLIDSCDLVISVINTAVHIAGSIGKETWCLVPKGVSGAWKFTKDEYNIWHPSVKHFHQAQPYKWADVIARVEKDFDKWLKAKKLQSSLRSPKKGSMSTEKGSSKPGETTDQPTA